MALPDRTYRRSPAGQQILTNPDKTYPLEYQRILAVIEGVTHGDVIRGCLRQFPDTLLADWLAEMEELGYLSSTEADSTQSLDFTDLFKAAQLAAAQSVAAPLSAQDRKRIERQTSQAAAALDGKGAFLALDRIKNREPLAKTPAEISVLVVEDDPDQAAIADLRVSMAGYRVRLAENLKALREEFSAGRLPDILLLDIRLPDGDGFEILAALRRHPKLALLPVVMLTVVTGTENVRRGIELGADGYITKPYSKKIVVETIRDVLKHA